MELENIVVIVVTVFHPGEKVLVGCDARKKTCRLFHQNEGKKAYLLLLQKVGILLLHATCQTS